MAVVIIGVAALACLPGATRGLIGSFVGAVIGTLAAAGLVRMVTDESAAAAMAPAELMLSALAIAVVGLALTAVAPYLTGALALAWTIGALVAALAALDAGRLEYVLPLLVHAAVAAPLLQACRSSVGRRLA
jgi:N-acetylmuramic acid 6-phosphate (MurNAc-6-P) etherase